MGFSDHYTRQIIDFYYDFDDNYDYKTLNKINATIDELSEHASPRQFKERTEQIRDEYFCSARRFLMEYVKNLSVLNGDGSYTLTYKENVYHFSGSGMDAARNLSKEERDQYIALLTDMAMDHNETDRSKEMYAWWRKLFRIAMLWNKNPRLLTKEEGLLICHGLQFSLKQANDFLVRVLENDSFNYCSSDDIIEIFCFLHDDANNWHMAQLLKNEYQEKASAIPKLSADDKPQAGTRLLLDSLPANIQKWEQNKENCPVEDAFMEWLLRHAEKMDLVSKTSYEMYRNLSCMAYKIIVDLDKDTIIDQDENSISNPDKNNFSDHKRDYTYLFNAEEELSIQINDFLQDNQEAISQISSQVSIYDIQRKLLTYMIHEFDNRRIHNPKEYWRAWRYITVGSDGNLTTQKIGNRMIALLSGTEFVQKADLLVLIWVICHIHWSNSSITNPKSIFNDRIQDFLNFSEDALSDAMLPEFYAPHLLEQTMLMSICHICDDSLEESLEPLEIYQEMCEAYTPRRVRGKKSDSPGSNSNSASTPNLASSSNSASGQNFAQKAEKILHDYRHIWEAEVKEDFVQGKWIYDGLERKIANHLFQNAEEKKDYIFQPEGISYAPDPEIIIPFSGESGEFARSLFQKEAPDYKELTSYETRFKYLYAIYLYLQKAARDAGHTLRCGVYYKSECKIAITRWI